MYYILSVEVYIMVHGTKYQVFTTGTWVGVRDTLSCDHTDWILGHELM